MKKVMILMALLLAVNGISAQDNEKKFSIKPMAGVNVSTLSGGLDDEYLTRTGFTGGVEAEYRATKWLGISIGASYSQQGAKYDYHTQMYMRASSSGTSDSYEMVQRDAKVTGHRKCDYLSIPLLACFHIPSVKGLALKTGVQLNVLLSEKMHKDILSIKNLDVESDFLETDTQDFWLIEQSKDITKKTDIGIPVGISYEWKNIVAEARYYFGLTKIDNRNFQEATKVKGTSEYMNPADERNRVFSFTIGYRFNL